MENLLFVRPSLDMKKAALDYQAEHLERGETVLHGSALMDTIPYDQWVQRTPSIRTGWRRTPFLPCGEWTGGSSAW